MKDGLGCKQNFSDLGVDSFCFRGTTSTRSEPFEVIMFCCAGWKQGAQLRKHIDATLGSGNLREAVRLPPGEDLFEWLAVNSNFSHIFLLLQGRERARIIEALFSGTMNLCIYSFF
jgi:hypothetical protein